MLSNSDSMLMKSMMEFSEIANTSPFSLPLILTGFPDFNVFFPLYLCFMLSVGLYCTTRIALQTAINAIDSLAKLFVELFVLLPPIPVALLGTTFVIIHELFCARALFLAARDISFPADDRKYSLEA